MIVTAGMLTEGQKERKRQRGDVACQKQRLSKTNTEQAGVKTKENGNLRSVFSMDHKALRKLV